MAPYEVRTSKPKGPGGGIGDTVVAVYAVCGLADTTGRRVRLFTRWCEWVERVRHPLVSIEPYQETGVDISGGWDGPNGYHAATASAPSRAAAYCATLAAAFGVPKFSPRRPPLDCVSPYVGGQPRQLVVVSPFSAYGNREWPETSWGEFATAMAADHATVLGIGTYEQAERMQQTLPGQLHICGDQPHAVTAMMLGASVVVGNDSGLVHVAGLLNVPAVAVHAGSLPHEYLFAYAPSVRSVTAGFPLPRYDSAPGALYGIKPARVVAAVRDVLASA